MLKVYLDRGAKQSGDDAIVSVAAVVFKLTPYKQFLRPWERMLDRWKASAFHATDFYSGAKEFNRDIPKRKNLFDDDSRRIPRIIGDRVKLVLVVSFRPEEFNHVASEQFKNKYGTNLHSLAVQMVLISMGWWAEEHHPSEQFAYFMEGGDENIGEVLQTVERVRRDGLVGPLIRVCSFTSVEKGMDRGLEAADFVAWHWNKYYMDKLRLGKGDRPRKDFAEFVKISKRKVHTIFLTGEYLTYFLSLAPKYGMEEVNKKSNRGARANRGAFDPLAMKRGGSSPPPTTTRSRENRESV